MPIDTKILLGKKEVVIAGPAEKLELVLSPTEVKGDLSVVRSDFN